VKCKTYTRGVRLEMHVVKGLNVHLKKVITLLWSLVDTRCSQIFSKLQDALVLNKIMVGLGQSVSKS